MEKELIHYRQFTWEKIKSIRSGEIIKNIPPKLGDLAEREDVDYNFVCSLDLDQIREYTGVI